MESFDHEAYLQANMGQLTAIKTALEHIGNSASEQFVVTTDYCGRRAKVVRDDFAIDHSDNELEIDQATIEKLAAIKKKARLSSARIALTGLQTHVSMHCLAEYIKEHPQSGGLDMPWGQQGDDVLIPYMTGWYVLTSSALPDNKTLEISQAHIRGIAFEGIESADAHVLTINEEALTQTLAISSRDGTIYNIQYKVGLSADPLIHRCITLFGSVFHELFLMLSGGINEDELNGKLNDIWLDYQGSSQEEEIGPLLEEVGQRARAVIHARELNFEHNVNLPSKQKLDELQQLLH